MRVLFFNFTVYLKVLSVSIIWKKMLNKCGIIIITSGKHLQTFFKHVTKTFVHLKATALIKPILVFRFKT